jgi:hypothetical protein
LGGGNFFERLVEYQGGLHAGTEFGAFQINLSTQIVSNTGQANASTQKINIIRHGKILLLAELPQEPIRPKPSRRLHVPAHRLIAAPGSVANIADHTGSEYA